MKYSKIILLLSFLVPLIAKAQDPEFTQTMASPMYFNPAFAGIQQNFRTSGQSRIQWPGVSGAFNTNTITADIGFTKINSGVGLAYEHDQAGDEKWTTDAISVFYAYEIKLGLGSYLRFGINPSFFKRTIDFSGLRFGDQIDPKTGFVYPTQEKLPGNGVYSSGLTPNFGSGALYYNSHIYAGVAVYNIFQPSQSFFGNPNSVLYRRYDLQGGGFIGLGKWNLNPNLLVMHQGNFTQALLGLNATIGMFTFGTSFRQTDPNADALNFLVGFAKGKFKVCYSYDITVSDARAAAQGSHELSLVFQLNKPHDTTEKPMIGFLRGAF